MNIDKLKYILYNVFGDVILRIISGKYKGKVIKEYNIVGTRPTMDRIKESVFGMIQTYLEGSICLDLFCGSGSLGIEALSNGGKECYFVDKNRKVTEILKNNTKDIENVYIINKDYQSFLKNTNIKFDIIFLDPPYDLFLINSAIKLIEENDLLNNNGLIICEYTKENIKSSYEVFKEKKYGDKYIKIYRKNA